MAWVRIDDQFADHPKIKAAGAVGMAIQIAAICYCNRYLTDGFISYSSADSIISGVISDVTGSDTLSDTPSEGRATLEAQTLKPDVIYTLGFTSGMSGRDASDFHWPSILVNVRLWEAVSGGYLIHDYLEYNPTKEEVLRRRELSSKGGKASQESKSHSKPHSKPRSSDTPSYPNPTPLPNPDKIKEEEIKNPPTPQPFELPIYALGVIQLWNENITGTSWHKTNPESIRKRTDWLLKRILETQYDPDFNIMIVLNKAKESVFLTGFSGFNLGWILKTDEKTNDKNYRRIMRGDFKNSTTGTGKQPVNHSPGHCITGQHYPGWNDPDTP
jgi:hypothetical protein